MMREKVGGTEVERGQDKLCYSKYERSCLDKNQTTNRETDDEM